MRMIFSHQFFFCCVLCISLGQTFQRDLPFEICSSRACTLLRMPSQNDQLHAGASGDGRCSQVRSPHTRVNNSRKGNVHSVEAGELSPPLQLQSRYFSVMKYVQFGTSQDNLFIRLCLTPPTSYTNNFNKVN